jgi:hypothetical protein
MGVAMTVTIFRLHNPAYSVETGGILYLAFSNLHNNGW